MGVLLHSLLWYRNSSQFCLGPSDWRCNLRGLAQRCSAGDWDGPVLQWKAASDLLLPSLASSWEAGWRHRGERAVERWKTGQRFPSAGGMACAVGGLRAWPLQGRWFCGGMLGFARRCFCICSCGVAWLRCGCSCCFGVFFPSSSECVLWPLPTLVLPVKEGMSCECGLERGKVCSCDELLKELVLPSTKKVLSSHSQVLLFFCGAGHSQRSHFGGLDYAMSCGERQGIWDFVESTEQSTRVTWRWQTWE